jgi:hypothetical protein
MIDRLSPREREELQRAQAAGEAWARLIAGCFLQPDGRLRLGIDRAATAGEIARATALPERDLQAAVAAAARWCLAHRLHLMEFPAGDPGADWRYLLAVG